MLLILALILLVITIVLFFVGIYRGSDRFAVEKRIEQIRETEPPEFPSLAALRRSPGMAGVIS